MPVLSDREGEDRMKQNRNRKRELLLLPFLLLLLGTGCADRTGMTPQKPTVTAEPTKEAGGEEMKEPTVQYSKVKIQEQKTYQTWETFGTSGAWWAQYVGGWDQPYREGELPVREAIARLLYSKEEGIGLTCYRYNVGAGSKEAGNGTFWDENRRAECFETAPGVYDFSKDANAVWFLKRVTELAGEDLSVVFFCNSPLTRLTVNGMAHMTEGGSKVNLLPEQYDDFADYVFDVTEHFLEEGIPVTEISPINEPQWDWYNGQEGCHYEPQEAADVYEVFVREIAKREALSGVTISGPESGEWGGRTQEYVNALFRKPLLRDYFTTLDCHSYWTTRSTKEDFARFMKLYYPEVKLRTSEWVEMVNGDDYTMDSAFNMADVIYEDLTILNVVSWQYWVGVAPGNYRDGLIYVNTGAKAYRAAKRLWGYGNFSRFIRPGYVRVECSNPYTDLYQMKSVAFTGTEEDGTQRLVLVLINREEEKQFQLALSEENKYNAYQVYTTNEERDLELTKEGVYQEGQAFTIEGASIVTIVLTAE